MQTTWHGACALRTERFPILAHEKDNGINIASTPAEERRVMPALKLYCLSFLSQVRAAMHGPAI
jgi:hypothetical protein